MQTRSYSIPHILNRVKAGFFRIPQFQRDFTWRESQVKLLVDSVGRNYPMGSLLVLEENAQIDLQSRKIDAFLDEDADPEDQAEETPSGCEGDSSVAYVLDGQQRLTAIVRVFLDASKKRNYYFDLKEIATDFDRESTAWMVTRSRGKSNPERKDSNRFLRCDVVLDQKKSQIYVQEYVEDSNDFPNLDKPGKRETSAKINQVFETIRNYEVPIVVLDSSQPLESICRVFETINSTGTRLTTFDLAVAKYFKSIDLRARWEESVAQYQILHDFDVDGERVMQILALVHAHENERYAEATRGTILSLPVDNIARRWNDCACALAEAYQWAVENGATPATLPNPPLLVSLGAFFLCFPREKRDRVTGFEPKLKRWYFSKSFQTGMRQHYRVAQDFMSLADHFGKGDRKLNEPFVYLDESVLKAIRMPSDTRYRALMCVLALKARTDLLTGAPLRHLAPGSVSGKYNEIEDHHFFPLARLRKKKELTRYKDSILNRVLVNKSTNRSFLDKEPSVYMAELFSKAERDGTLQQLRQRLFDHALPVPEGQGEPAIQDTYGMESFLPFLEKRAKLVLQQVREIIGDLLHEKEPEGEDDNED
ncbi:MAG: DUF262 domain-containing protein [Thermoguttaceae bacterium]|jgi:hypothetical protein